MDKLEVDMKLLQNIKEVDNEINLKYNYEKHLIFADSTFKNTMPKIFNYLKISLDSVDTGFQEQIEKLKVVVEKEQVQRQKIDELSLKFRQKYSD